MTHFSRYLFLPVLAFTSFIVSAQTKDASADQVYGHDPLLYNGRIYTYIPPAGAGGFQYINESFDVQGIVKLRGVVYPNVTLNYDLYNQQLILKYRNEIGSHTLIQVSGAWLEMFEINGQHFEIMTSADTTKRILQVIGTGQYSIRYYYYKDLVPDTRTSSKKFVFTDYERDMFVYCQSKIIRYKNNRSFVSIFDDQHKEMIRKYLRKKNIRVKKASDTRILEFLTYCNTLCVL